MIESTPPPMPPAGPPPVEPQPQFPPPHHAFGAPSWGVAAAPEPPVGGRSGQAVASFVLGLLGIVPAALVFGILALVRIGRTRQKGKALAVLGIVLSGLWLVAGAVGMLALALHTQGTTLAGSRSSATRPALSGPQPLDSVPLGTCFDVPATGDPLMVTVVRCTELHDRQLFAKVSLTGTYPGLEEDRRQSLAACVQAESTQFADPSTVLERAYVSDYYPPESDWDPAGSQAWCVLDKLSSGLQLTTDLMQDPAQYTARQRMLLDMLRQTALFRVEVGYAPAADWSQTRQFATRLAAAEREEAHSLSTSTLFDTPALRELAASLAADDRNEAVLVDTLAASASQAQWQTRLHPLFSDHQSQGTQMLRANFQLF